MIDSQALSQHIMRMVRDISYTVSDNAPDTFITLKNAPSLIVWAGASENTIYTHNVVNWAFRAWHDNIHLKLNVPFTLEGELYVATTQANLVHSDSVAKIILAEVQGQAEYFARHGEFPVDQKTFINAYLAANVK